jgi:hypothetical protein
LVLGRASLAQILRRPYDPTFIPNSANSWPQSLRDPTKYYRNCVRYFYQAAPRYLVDHRHYFSQDGRGFGEAAFHVMWDSLFSIFKPSSFLEIGVYRGQTLSLASLCSRESSFPARVCGISPFTSAADSVSKYSNQINYYEDALKNFAFFKLPAPHLVRGLSTEPHVWKQVAQHKWDMVYIDGNHDYEVAKSDFANCNKILAPRGLIVLDDSGLFTRYQAPLFSTAGHFGPSKLAGEISALGFQELLQVGHNRVFQKNT